MTAKEVRDHIVLMRPQHFIKNGLVFAGLLCSGQFFVWHKLLVCCSGFCAFCLMSSVIYIINDIHDREKDRTHPTKCKRPLAAGTVTVRSAKRLALVLFLGAMLFNGLVWKAGAAGLLGLYFLLNLLYSAGLKDVPIVDVVILVSGFLIRILYGAIITNIVISNWLYLTVISMAFYFALGKRRNELQQSGDNSQARPVNNCYPLNFLNQNMYLCLTMANVFYALWSMDEHTVASYHSTGLVYTAPIVWIITMKYSLDIESKPDGDPVTVLLHDKVLMILCALYFVVMFTILYL